MPPDNVAGLGARLLLKDIGGVLIKMLSIVVNRTKQLTFWDYD